MFNDKKRILIVDDEASMTRLLKLNLEQTANFIVRVENAATRALSAAEEFQPDLILLDVMMPDQDGGELAARFKASILFSRVPIVFLTAAIKREEVKVRGGLIGGLPFIAKPVEMRELVRCLNQALVPA